MENNIVIAVDAMGGDLGCTPIIEGALQASKSDNVHIILVGDVGKIESCLTNVDTTGTKFSLHNASEVVTMEDKPADVLRKKRDSSIHQTCQLVKQGKAHAFVSAGNSGASVACGMFIVGRLSGVDRPALASIMPSEENPFTMLDLGATVDCHPTNLLQFAIMGSILTQNLLDIQEPRIALLNIGEEEGKGNVLVREAYELLKNIYSMHFIGNIEGKDIYKGHADVVVCDGFIGNIVLKLSEGLAATITRMLKDSIKEDILSRLGALLALPAFRRLKKKTDYAEYGGALILGLQQIGIVAHGRSNAKAIQSAVEMAITLVKKDTCAQIAQHIEMNLVST